MWYVGQFNVAYELWIMKFNCIYFGVQQFYIWRVYFHCKEEKTRRKATQVFHLTFLADAYFVWFVPICAVVAFCVYGY